MCNDPSFDLLKNRQFDCEPLCKPRCDKFSSLCSREAGSKVVCNFFNQPNVRQADEVIQSEMEKCVQIETYYDNNKAKCDKLNYMCDRKGLCRFNDYIAYLIENDKL